MPEVPSFAYPGGKALTRRWICRHFPHRCRRYVEPFTGRGNVYWMAREIIQFEEVWLNDLQTIPFFRALQESTEEQLAEAVGTSRPTRERFEQLRDNRADLASIVCEPWVSYCGAGYNVAGGSLEVAKIASPLGYLMDIIHASRAIKRDRATLTAVDFSAVLDNCEPGDFVYLDPPYRDAKVSGYTGKTVDFSKMIEQLRAAKFRWLLSEYRHADYDSAFGEPISTKNIQMSMAADTKSHRRIECLYSNFSPEGLFALL